MVFEGVALDALEEADLLALVAAQAAERRTLDYKAQLPGPTDGDRKEFLNDVTSFANAAGGHLIYGISESGGIPTAVPGIHADPEATILRLEQLAQTGIDPRVPGLDWHPIRLSNGSYSFVGRIPRSWVAPHMVVLQDSNKFYSRNATGKYLLDVRQLRELFSGFKGREDGARRFRDERLGRIIANDVPKSIGGPKIVLHLVPLDATDYESRERAHLLYEEAWVRRHESELSPSSDTKSSRFIAADGLVSYNVDNGGLVVAYTHVFPNGAVEAVAGSCFQPEENPGRHRGQVEAHILEGETVMRTNRLMAAQRALGVEPPLLILAALLEVRAYQWIAAGLAHPKVFAPHDFERDTILLPPVLVPSWPEDLAQTLRPLFDAIANAAGWPRSPYFDPEGNWVRT